LGFLILRLARPHPRQSEEESRQGSEIDADGDVATIQA
jgi:hypothetical protein